MKSYLVFLTMSDGTIIIRQMIAESNAHAVVLITEKNPIWEHEGAFYFCSALVKAHAKLE